MPAVADLVLRAAGATDLPREIQDPVAHDPRWIWLALVLTVAVVALVALPGVLRRRAARVRRPRPRDVLRAIDQVARDVETGRIPAGVGHQRLSSVVRDFAGARSGLPVAAMTLGDLERWEVDEEHRADRLPGLTRLVGELYPPEFSGREDLAAAAFARSLSRARDVVRSWT